MSSALPTVLYIPSIYAEHQPEEWSRFSNRFNILTYDCPTVDDFVKALQPGEKYSTIDAIMRPSWLKAPPFHNQQVFAGEPVNHFPPSLKIIASGGHGYDIVDVDRLTERGIWFCNSPDTCTEATANCAMYLILDAYRYFHFADHCIRINEYVESRSIARMAEDPSGHVLAMIGLGNIGLAIAQRAEAFGMKIHYYTPKRKLQSESKLRTTPVYHDSLDSIFAVADCICLSCPYTRETHHMLGPRAFSLMKKGVRIVNIARGKLIDEEALLNAMDEGKVVGLGVDVHEHEPEVNPRLKANYMTTLLPHIGVCSKTSWRNFETNCIKNLEAYFYGDDGVPVTPVNYIAPNPRLKQLDNHLQN